MKNRLFINVLLTCLTVLLTGQELLSAPLDPNSTPPADLAQKDFWDRIGSWTREFPLEIHGFGEVRAGGRFLNDPHEKDMSIMETRMQWDFFAPLEQMSLKYKADVYGDFVTKDVHYDMREGNITVPFEFMDVKVGRQILTWGTGDLIFINDLFPKDWVSFFIGRDTEYLKAPSDAAKVSFFHDWANLDLVFTPQFDPDRGITGERISYYDPFSGDLAGENAKISAGNPDRWFRDYELALRLYRNINSYECALYGYRGFWKSPGGFDLAGRAIYPDLNVYGSSIRGPLAQGIANLEVGYYQSADNESGRDPLVKNSEMRYLVGYTRELARDFTGGLQYYVEQMVNYDNYVCFLPASIPARDEYRQVMTVRLTKLLMNQNLRLSFFTYYSPSDSDVYARPQINYKINDNLAIESGFNVFFGDYPYTFFGQFHRNSNFYAAVRYSF